VTELGRIERPEAEGFRAGRKLYLVPLVYSPADPPADYVAMLARYWGGVREHLRRLEDRIGVATRLYHETVPAPGAEGMEIVRQVNIRSHEVCQLRVEAGATLEALEDPEMLAETIDWQRCLMIGLTTQKVIQLIWGNYREASKRRYEEMARRLDATLGAGEAGLLFLLEDHQLQFPSGIQVFYVAPPALDEIHRWQRNRSQSEAAGAAGEAPDGD